MPEVKHPKKYYYTMRNRCMRDLKQIGQSLSLALTEEEDALLWEKYKKVLERWRRLERPEGVNHREDLRLRQNRFWRPVFNDEYIELTRQLTAIYDRKRGEKSKQEQNRIEEEIRAIKKKRYSVTTYYDRETGEKVTPW